MPEQDSSVTKKMGRPNGRVQPETKPVRVPVPLLQALDAYVARLPHPKPSQPEAILEDRLAAEGLLQTNAALKRQIADHEGAIADMPGHDEPSPATGMAAMQKGLAQNDLVDMKNERTRRNSSRQK